MTRSSSRRWLRLVLPAVGLLVGVAALAAFVDWYAVLPEELQATYVGSDVCRECHEQEVRDWLGSDHQLAMDWATPESVLGDFEEREFIRVPFLEFPGLLSEEALHTLLSHTDAESWAVAMKTAEAALRDTLLAAMPAERAEAVRKAMANRTQVRPCEATTARYQLGQTAAKLVAAGQIEVSGALRSRLWRENGRYYVRTDGPDGNDQVFPVKYTFGVQPPQQYLVPMPRGRLQCLPIAWDLKEEAWLHLYPDEAIPHDDVLHWTRPLQNWNYMCADCHSTNLQKNYNVHTDTYHTTFSEINVSCETCHGPGSIHTQLSEANSLFWDRRRGYGLPNLKSEDSRVEIETCAPCHARRRVIYPGFKPGKRFLDYFIPEMLDTGLYYADGQILDEDYEYSSFLQSVMYRQGVRCTDCHDPHTARVKFDDNRLCGQCHLAAQYDTPQHHYHPDSTQSGTLCVECHMPTTTYMVVDPRRDHSMNTPRPHLSVALGIPNACTGCHDDVSKGETPEWAVEQVETWYGKPKGPPHFAYAIAAGREGKPAGRRMLQEVARRQDESAIVRASAVALLGRYPATRPYTAQTEGLRDPEALVRLGAVRSLQDSPPPILAEYLPGLCADPIRAVRTEAARLLSTVPGLKLSERHRVAFEQALQEYMDAQHYLADQPAAHLNMAVVLNSRGMPQKALEAYQTALRLDAAFVPARLNLAMLFDQLGDKAQAEEQLRKAVEIEPGLAEGHYSLGLLLAEDPSRLTEAVEQLQAASRLGPENPRIHYNLGLALQHLGRMDEAERALRSANKLAPNLPEYLHALAILYSQQSSWAKAIACAEELVRRHPDQPQYQVLLGQIRRQAAQHR